jgi:hypothetical protein
MAAHLDQKPNADAKESRWSERDARVLLVLSSELLRLCAKLAGPINPAAAAMLTYVNEEISSEGEEELQ